MIHHIKNVRLNDYYNFGTNIRNWIDLGKKIWRITLVVVDLFTLKLMLYRLIITYFGRPKNAPDCTIFIKLFCGGRGCDAFDLQARVGIHIITGLHTRLVCNCLSRYLKNAEIYYLDKTS